MTTICLILDFENHCVQVLLIKVALASIGRVNPFTQSRIMLQIMGLAHKNAMKLQSTMHLLYVKPL